MERPEQPDAAPKRSAPTIKSIKARLRIQPSRWFVRPARWFRAAFEQGPEQILPFALLFGLLVSMASLFSSAAMLYMHVPVHTVLCHEQKPAGSSFGAPSACYPNFFVSAWMLVFAASALSGLFYAFLCIQQEQLRLRQGAAMLGSFLAMFLWMCTIVFGFLPAQVSTDPSSLVPQVRAFGMLSSSIENYMYAHNKTQMPSATAAAQGRSGQLVWVIGGGYGGALAKGPEPRPPVMVASVYRKHGEANRFAYSTDSIRVAAKAHVPRRVDGPARDQAGTPQTDNTTEPRTGAKKMVGKQLRSQRAVKPARANMYEHKFFYQDETKMALATAILAPVSFVVSFNVFLLLGAYPFI